MKNPAPQTFLLGSRQGAWYTPGMPAHLLIRPATTQDLDFLDEQDPLLVREAIAQKIQDGEVYLAELNGQRAGFARYAYFCDLEPFLTLILVLDPYKRQGIGTQLMLYWEQAMRTKGYHFLMTSTQADEDAQFFYRRLGYTDTGALLLPGQAATELVLLKYLTDEDGQHSPRQKRPPGTSSPIGRHQSRTTWQP